MNDEIYVHQLADNLSIYAYYPDTPTSDIAWRKLVTNNLVLFRWSVIPSIKDLRWFYT